MILTDDKGEMDLGAGDEFRVRSAAGVARVEVILHDDSLSLETKSEMFCCRLLEGRLSATGQHLLKPPAIVYYLGADIVAARRAFLDGGEPPAIQVRFIEAR